MTVSAHKRHIRCCFLHFFNLKTSLSDSENSGVKVVACTSVCERLL